MKTASAKAKGRNLQNWVRDMLLHVFPDLTKDDVRCAIMGETGADVKLSPKARLAFDFGIECKNQEAFTNVYKAYEQAGKHCEADRMGIPIVFLKMNHKKPLVVIDAEYFIRNCTSE